MRKLLLLLVLTHLGWAEPLTFWGRLDREVEAAIEAGHAPGAELLVGRHGEVLYHRVYGEKSAGVRLLPGALFDAASLTKPLVTATSILLLAQQGKVALDAPVSRYLPVAWEESPTVAQLLTHHSGLPAEISPDRLPDGLLSVELKGKPGSFFVYSDVGYMLLGEIVERQSGVPLEQFYQERIAEPLKLSSTFHPDPARAVPTHEVEPGIVHDPKARKLGGVAGHAGLFLSALDVHRQLAGLPTLLDDRSLELFFTVQQGGRTFGLDAETGFSSPRGRRFSPLTGGGHTGFTGTSFWWDRPSGLHVILLTSRLHPDGEGNVIPLRRVLSTLVAEEFLGRQVETGLDRLSAGNFETLKGQKVGFVLNHTSRDRWGRHLLDLLPADPDFEVRALFTPEHGLTGTREGNLEHGRHPGLDVPIYSLYGESRAPALDWLRDLDLLVFDLQDVGVRYYTYISTLKACLEAARQTGTGVLVLDRPNPLGGEVVDGHPATEFSFIACDALPLVHGLTMGEVARFLNREIGASLKVEPMRGWSRGMTWAETGLPLLSPSPNLAELESIKLYPVLGQMEWSQLSVGRGTRSPFRLFGAPYIKDPTALAEELAAAVGHPLRFRPRFFVPETGPYAGELCGGVELESVGQLLGPAAAGTEIAQLLARRYPGRFDLQRMARHLGCSDVERYLTETPDLRAWLRAREPYLLYP